MKNIFKNSKLNNSLGVLIVSVLALASCGGGGGGAYTTTKVAIKSTTVAPGDTHTCASLPEGTVKCWGDNSYGQLGTDWILPRVYSPITVSGINNAQALTSGSSYTCALLQDSTVSCWGSNISGQLGDGTTIDSFTLVKVSGLSNVTAVSASHGRLDNYGHTCALLSDTTVKCWGRNIVGQLGTGAITDSTTPVAVSGLSGVAAIAAGGWHTCALMTNGTVMCWGDNSSGQLGNGTISPMSTSPVLVSGITNATAIALGSISSCAILADQSVQCWGNNGQGRLGNPTITLGANYSTPLAVSLPSSAIGITAGRGHACALLSDNTVKCWGDNSAAMLGNGTLTSSATPVTVSGLSGAISVTAGSTHTCARLADTTVKCWGDNANAQVGPGSTTHSSTPAPVLRYSPATPLSLVSTVTAGSQHGCGLLSDGTVDCWGWNGSNQLGTTAFARSSTAAVVGGVSAASVLSAGGWHNCALLPDGSISCWGDNANGQLGDGTLTNSATPVAVSGIFNQTTTYPNPGGVGTLPIIHTTKSVAAGVARTCAIIEHDTDTGVCQAGGACPVHSITDTIKCWGDNDQGQLGDGTISATPVTAPVDVLNITTAAAVAGGYNHTCSLLSGGTIQCWGANYSGQLGNGTLTGSSIPVDVSGITTAIALSEGNMNDHSCAALQDGTVRCWGDNSFGQLGDGTLVSSSTPVAVPGLYNVTKVATGFGHTCALLIDNIVKCWGWNVLGQLGNGLTKDSTVPVTVSGLPPPSVGLLWSIATGFAQTCATLTSGGVYCWGDNSFAQLGRGALSTSITTPAGISVEKRTSNYPSCVIAFLRSGPAVCVLDGNLVFRMPNFYFVIPLPPD